MLFSIALGFVPVFDFDCPDVLGWVIVFCALALFFWAASWFKRKGTTIIPRQKPSALIVEGSFKIRRNPIYLSMVFLTLGVAFIMGNVAIFLPVFWLWWFLHKTMSAPKNVNYAKALV